MSANPFVEGDYYPGDLMTNVVQKVSPQFWKEHPLLQAQWKPLAPYAAAVERYLKEGLAFPAL